jgi:hypothetical protein
VAPIFNFIQNKLFSTNWVEKYISALAFGAIIEGPSPQMIEQIIGQAYPSFINMLSDPVPKVRNCMAWVFYKIAEHVPGLILGSQDNLNQFMNASILRLDDHPRIVMLVYSSIKSVFDKAAMYKVSYYLNPYFGRVLQEAMSSMYKEDVVKNNLQGVLSAIINEIVEKCDAEGLKSTLKEVLNAVLNELYSMAAGQH